MVKLYNRCPALSIKPKLLKANRFAFVKFTIIILFFVQFRADFCALLLNAQISDRIAFFQPGTEADPGRAALLFPADAVQKHGYRPF